MKNSIILNDNQVNRLQQTGTVVVVDMVKYSKTVKEPTFGYTVFTPKNNISLRGYFNWEEDGIKQLRYGEKFIKLPYQAGSTVYVREPWALVYDDIYLKANYKRDYSIPIDWSEPNWKSPATMPKSAARLFPVVHKVKVVRCNEINALQRNNIGLLTTSFESAIIEKLRHIMSFRDYITSRFGQSFWDGNGWIFLTTLKLTK